jgi:hypothetical protein
MDTFDIQVMLKDGSFIDYEVRSKSNEDYDIFKDGNHLITFKANEDGTWIALDNRENINEELQERITNQLNGFRR